MRLHRIALVATWMAVSLVAVVGFANFTTSRTPAAVDRPTEVTYAPDLGMDAGAGAALAFVYLTDRNGLPTKPATDTTELEAPTTSAPAGRSTTTFVRSTMLNESAVRAIVGRHFQPDDVARALRAAWCASSFNPGTVNSDSGASGLFQLTSDQFAQYATDAGYPGGDMLDPEVNTAVAAWIVYNVEGSWSNLTCTG
jgi:hypothetical protein